MTFAERFPIDLGHGLRARLVCMGGRPAFLEISADGKSRCVHAFDHAATWDWDATVAIEQESPLTIDGMLWSQHGAGQIVKGRWVPAA